jgi:hypothetical protein
MKKTFSKIGFFPNPFLQSPSHFSGSMPRRRKKACACYLYFLFRGYITQTWLVHFILMVCLCAAGERCGAVMHPSILCLLLNTKRSNVRRMADANFVSQIVKLLVSVRFLPVTCVALCVQVLIRQVFLCLCVCVCACVNVNLTLPVLPSTEINKC